MTTEEMAQGLGIKLCTGMLPTGRKCHFNHLVGSVHEGTLHFYSRVMGKADTLAFLRAASSLLDPSLRDDPPWLRVYRQNMAFRAMSKKLGIRPPDPATDKKFVLASVVDMSNEVPMRRQAFDWARRHGGRRT